MSSTRYLATLATVRGRRDVIHFIAAMECTNETSEFMVWKRTPNF